MFVTPFPGPGEPRQLSTEGGLQPRWRRDGKEIFYISVAGRLMAAPVALSADRVDVGAAQPLFEVSRTGIQKSIYDVSSDGQRFLVNIADVQGQTNPITLIVNWTAGLKP